MKPDGQTSKQVDWIYTGNQFHWKCWGGGLAVNNSEP